MQLRVLYAFAFFISTFSAGAQTFTARTNVAMTGLSNGYYEYLPQGYDTGSETYPLIIFVHGLGELGNGNTQLINVLRNGTPKQISQGIFPVSFTVGGQTFKFIVLCPQFIDWPGNAEVNNIIDYAVSHYRVDINRVYLTGLSMGGGVVWEYAGGWPYYASRIAAIVPICGASWPDQGRAEVMAAANLPVWATHNDGDPTAPLFYTVDYVNYINNAPTPPNPLAKKTIFNSSSHDAWSATYDLNFRENGLNVYEWMLQYKRNLTVLASTGLSFSAIKNGSSSRLNWTTQTEINNQGFDVQRSADGIHFTSIGYVASTGTTGASYSFTDASPLAGNNFYRVQLRDNSGSPSFSETKLLSYDVAADINIYPNPVTDFLNLHTSHYFLNTRLNILDARGAIVQTATLNGSGNISVKLSRLPAGLYVAVVNDGFVNVSIRFIKN